VRSALNAFLDPVASHDGCSAPKGKIVIIFNIDSEIESIKKIPPRIPHEEGFHV